MLFNPLLNLFFAHEVYVLPPEKISDDYANKNVSAFDALNSAGNLKVMAIMSIFIAGFFGLAVVLKYTQAFQKAGKFIDRFTKFAPDFIRIIFGLSLVSSAYHNALYGPELPLGLFPGSELIRILLYVSGLALIIGVFTRFFGWLSVLTYLYAFVFKDWYMLTYASYLGEAIAVILLPRQNFSVDRLLVKRVAKETNASLEKFSMPVARILFGFALLYAAIKIKIFNPALSLDVATTYNLSDFFHLDPPMIVLGAALTEIMIALLYISGFMLRVTSVIFVVFVTLSLLYFKESVWPHYLLFGLAIGIFMHKPDMLALDSKRPSGRLKKLLFIKG